MVIMLIVAAVISAATGMIQGEPEWADVIIILTVVIINSVLGVVQEAKSEQALEALQQMSAAPVEGHPRRQDGAPALRGPRARRRHRARGGRLGACRLPRAREREHEDRGGRAHRRVRARGKHVDAIALAEGVDDVPLGDRKNMCYMGSTVVYGRGRAVVVATGMKTEMGKIADALTTAKKELTPLQMKLNELSVILTKLVLGICVVIFAVDIIRHFGELGSNPAMILDTSWLPCRSRSPRSPRALSPSSPSCSPWA